MPSGINRAWAKATTMSRTVACFRSSPASSSRGPTSSFTRERNKGLETTCLRRALFMHTSRIDWVDV